MQRFFAQIFVLFCLCFVSFEGFADLNTSLNALLQHQDAAEKVGIDVQNLNDGSILFSYNADEPMVPASTAKAFTAAAAYLTLGPAYRYQTSLLTNASLTRNLQGNIYIRFSGDPTLSSADIFSLVRKLRLEGVRNISGNVVLDQSVFSGPYYGIGWGPSDFVSCYGAPIAGAIINSNCSRMGVVKFPTVYAEEMVHFALTSSGIHVQGKIEEGVTPSNAETIATHYSNNLQNILNFMLKYSDDVYANAIFKTLGSKYDETGSYTDGAMVVKEVLIRHFGPTFATLQMKDGSGLSTLNRISPAQLVALYNAMYHRGTLGGMFRESLAISGQGGTLVYRMGNPLLRGHVYAKTGTFGHDKGGVSNLAGYLMLPGHPPIAFAIMMNNTGEDTLRAEALQDKIVELIAENQLGQRDNAS